MRVRNENVICFDDILDLKVFGQDARSFQPRVQEDGETAGFQSESRSACNWVSDSLCEPRQDISEKANLPNHSIVVAIASLMIL
jgi:hypothetical protein